VQELPAHLVREPEDEDLRITGRSVAGGWLVVDGRLGHLVAFPTSKRAKRVPEEEVFNALRFSRTGAGE